MDNEIKDILVELLKNEDLKNISNEDDLTEYGLDSLQSIELVVLLEEKYSISFAEEDLLLEKISSVKKIIETINKYL